MLFLKEAETSNNNDNNNNNNNNNKKKKKKKKKKKNNNNNNKVFVGVFKTLNALTAGSYKSQLYIYNLM